MLSLARPFLGLPPRRCSVGQETVWVEMPDGVRLATRLFRPTGGVRAPAIVLRTPYGSRGWRHPIWLLARLVAESGYAVALQDVRGRYDSEGRFEPFANEAADGARTLCWVSEQPWYGGRIGLLGFSYLAFAAWAARTGGGVPAEDVRALALGIGAADVYAAFYPGGAFALETALRWSAGVGERTDVPERRLDLERAYAFRPARTADRVALRERPWYRDWADHPRPDAFWRRIVPAVSSPPPTLRVAGWYDFFLGPQLAEHADAPGDARLVIGPWAHGRSASLRETPLRSGFGRSALGEILAFLDLHLLEEGAPPAAPVRLLGTGEREWHEHAAWPPPSAGRRVLHLRSGGRANTLAGDGRLDPAAPGVGEPPDRYTYDPEDPVPSLGGPLLDAAGIADQRPVQARDDVLCYTSGRLDTELRLAGPVRVELHATSSAPDTDFTAKLCEVLPDGRARNLCEGIARARWREGGAEARWLEPDAPARIPIDLWAAGASVRAGHRLRLEVSSSNFPRFDRNANTRELPAAAEKGVPARQCVLHDAEHPSRLELTTLPSE